MMYLLFDAFSTHNYFRSENKNPHIFKAIIKKTFIQEGERMREKLNWNQLLCKRRQRDGLGAAGRNIPAGSNRRAIIVNEGNWSYT